MKYYFITMAFYAPGQTGAFLQSTVCNVHPFDFMASIKKSLKLNYQLIGYQEIPEEEYNKYKQLEVDKLI